MKKSQIQIEYFWRSRLGMKRSPNQVEPRKEADLFLKLYGPQIASSLFPGVPTRVGKGVIQGLLWKAYPSFLPHRQICERPHWPSRAERSGVSGHGCSSTSGMRDFPSTGRLSICPEVLSGLDLLRNAVLILLASAMCPFSSRYLDKALPMRRTSVKSALTDTSTNLLIDSNKSNFAIWSLVISAPYWE